MQSKSTIDNHREISAALDFLRQASVADGVLELDPRLVSGWVEMSLGALAVLVKAKRGKHADDKALKQTVEEHLSHASIHLDEAYESSVDECVSGHAGRSGLDDDNLPHYDHATARIALLYARKAIVEREKAENPLIELMVLPADNDVVTVTNRKQAEELFGVGSSIVELFRPAPRTYPNSCKVETDNKPGKVEAKCVTPIANWSACVDSASYVTSAKLWADDSLVSSCVNVNSGGTWSPGVPLTFAGVHFPKTKPIASAPIRGGGKLSFFSGTQPTKASQEIASNILGRTISIGSSAPIRVANIDRCDIAGVAIECAKAGETVLCCLNGQRFSWICDRDVKIGDFIYRRYLDKCHGCSYAKWPNKGHGYSARCDKCKLDPNRPGYVST